VKRWLGGLREFDRPALRGVGVARRSPPRRICPAAPDGNSRIGPGHRGAANVKSAVSNPRRPVDHSGDGVSLRAAHRHPNSCRRSGPD
jgi:hypothetical protein